MSLPVIVSLPSVPSSQTLELPAIRMPDKPLDRRALVDTLLHSEDSVDRQAAMIQLLTDSESLVSEYAATQFLQLYEKEETRTQLLSIVSAVIHDAPYLSARLLLKSLNAQHEDERQLLTTILED